MLTTFRVFYGPDDGGMGGEDISFEPLDTGTGIDFEVVPEPTGEPEEFKGKSREDIIKEMKAREDAFAAQRATLEGQASQTAALQGAFAGLAERLEKVAKGPQGPQAPQVPLSPKPYESPEQFEERIRTSLLVNPVQALSEVGERLWAPVLQQQAAATHSIARELVKLQPETKPIYDKYGAEIDALAATAPNNPRAYFEATEIVASRHRSELVAGEAVALAEKMLTEKLAALGIQGNQGSQGALAVKAPGNHVEGGVPKGPRVVNGKRVVQATPAQKAQWQAAADAKHMRLEDYYRIYVEDWQKEAQ